MLTLILFFLGITILSLLGVTLVFYIAIKMNLLPGVTFSLKQPSSAELGNIAPSPVNNIKAFLAGFEEIDKYKSISSRAAFTFSVKLDSDIPSTMLSTSKNLNTTIISGGSNRSYMFN